MSSSIALEMGLGGWFKELGVDWFLGRRINWQTSLGHEAEKIRGVKGAMVIPPWKVLGFFKLAEQTNLGYQGHWLLENSCFK